MRLTTQKYSAIVEDEIRPNFSIDDSLERFKTAISLASDNSGVIPF